MGFNVSTPPQGWGNLFRNWLIAGIQLLWRRQNSGGGGGSTPPGGSVNEIQYNAGGTFGGIGYGTTGQQLTSAGAGNVATWEDVTEPVNADWDAVSGLAEILNKPTIPAAQVNSDWDAVSGVAQILNKPNVVENPMVENMDASNFRITMLGTPIAMQDAANKAYVDTVAASLSWKTVVRVATAAAITGTYNNGASGVGATITVTATGVLTIDGVATVLGDRVLVRNQVSQFENGIYSVTTEGIIGVAAVLTRTTDADQSLELVSAAVATGSEGTANANKAYIQITPATIIVGTTAVVFNVFLNTILSPGTGIRISANIIYARLSEGVAGGQSVKGGTQADDTLIVQGSTSTDPRITADPAVIINSSGSLGDDDTAQIQLSVPVTITQSGTAGYTAVKVAVTETSTGSGTKNLVEYLAGASGTTSKFSIANTGSTTWADGANFIIGTGTGTKIGTATSQKIGFFNATPVVQQTGDIITALQTLGLVTSGTISFSSLLSTANTWTAAQRGAFTTLSYSATTTIDLAVGNNFRIQLTGNVTFGAPTNIVAGQSGVINIYQDNTGSRTAAWAWLFVFSGGTAPTLSTGKGSLDQCAYMVNTYATSTVTISNATPGVVTWTAHGLFSGQEIQFTTTGTLPTGLSPNTSYWINVTGANTFNVSSSFANYQAGTFINTSSAGSGTHTATAGSITITTNPNLQ